MRLGSTFTTIIESAMVTAAVFGTLLYRGTLGVIEWDMGSIVAVVFGLISVVITISGVTLGVAWWAGKFSTKSEKTDNDLSADVSELREQFHELQHQVRQIEKQGIENATDVKNLQELRREMLSTLDRIFDRLSRGAR